MMAKFLINILGGLIFLFLFWKRLKEDYSSEQIFAVAFFQLMAIGLGIGVASFFVNWWFWIIFVLLAIAILIGITKHKLRGLEALEASVFSLIPWLSLYFLYDSIKTSRVSSLIGFLLFLGAIGVFTLIDSRYKSFSWYKSGKVGFTGLVVLGLIFLIRSILAIFFQNVLSLVGKADIILSSVVAFAAFLLLFNLSRKI